MKKLLVLSALLTNVAIATPYSLEQTTHRVTGIGYDCGEFFKGTTEKAPKLFEDNKIEFTRLDADKDLNDFLIHAKSQIGDVTCEYGIFLNRERSDKTLNLTKLESTTSSLDSLSVCEEKISLLTEIFSKANYYASKRGIRYIAVDVINGENDVCTSGNVRAVFDRRLTE